VGEGRIAEVAAYCQEDMVNTYRIWLLHELFCGRLSSLFVGHSVLVVRQ
jgi:hypothetical protein